MKLITLILTVLLYSCVTAQYTVKAIWDSNTEPDMSHYQLFIGEIFVTDSLIVPDSIFVKGSQPSEYAQYYIKDISKVLVDSVVVTQEVSGNRNKWLQAGVCAVDSAGNSSQISPSNFIYLRDKESPGAVIWRLFKKD